MKTEIIKFIEQFQRPDTITVFTNGMCYWFAEILNKRFPKGQIVYDDIWNHFAYKLDSRIYDIMGDITDSDYHFEDWEDFKELDELHTCRLYKNCINKTEITDCENCINHNCKIKYNDEINYEKRKNP